MDKHSRGNLRNAALGLVAIGLIGLALAGYLSPLMRVSTNPLVSVQSWISTRYMALYEFFTVPRDVASLRQQNADLSAQISRLEAQVIEQQQQISEAQVLYSLLEFARGRPENQYVAATVIGRDPSPFLHYLIIDQGSDDGLLRGMPVVTQQGLAGRIDAVTASAARVQLITDPASAVNVQLRSTQTEAILTGSITGDISTKMIPQDLNVEPGEVVLTSGLGGNYPANIFIGQVVSIQRKENELFQEASIQPTVDYKALKVVLVITNFKPVDITPLEPTSVP
jgi:rod shape-determining protein MreC